jgi:hypothetical protein
MSPYPGAFDGENIGNMTGIVLQSEKEVTMGVTGRRIIAEGIVSAQRSRELKLVVGLRGTGDYTERGVDKWSSHRTEKPSSGRLWIARPPVCFPDIAVPLPIR